MVIIKNNKADLEKVQKELKKLKKTAKKNGKKDELKLILSIEEINKALMITASSLNETIQKSSKGFTENGNFAEMVLKMLKNQNERLEKLEKKQK